MKNRFKRIISCVSFLGLFLMSFLGLEAKAVIMIVLLFRIIKA